MLNRIKTMNKQIFTLLKKITALGYQVVLLYNSTLDLKIYYIQHSFTPPTGMVNHYNIEGLDITSLVEDKTLLNMLNPIIQAEMTADSRYFIKQSLDTKLSELKKSELRLSEDWSFLWIIN